MNITKLDLKTGDNHKRPSSILTSIFAIIGTISTIIVLVVGLGIYWVFSYFSTTQNEIAKFNCRDNYKLTIIKQSEYGFENGRFTYNYLALKKDENTKLLTKGDNKFAKSDFFPTVPAMREGIEYKIITELSKESSNKNKSISEIYISSQGGLKALYLSPDAFSRDEFNIVYDCYSQYQAKINSYTKDYSRSKEGYSLHIPILVYGVPNEKKSAGIPIYSTLVCDESRDIKVLTNGIANFTLYKTPDNLNNGSKKVKSSQAKESIGYYDSAGQFVRKPGKLSNPDVSYSGKTEELADGNNKRISDPAGKYLLINRGNDTQDSAILEKEIAKLLYNTDGPTDDFINNCKSNDGKTVYDLFKQD